MSPLSTGLLGYLKADFQTVSFKGAVVKVFYCRTCFMTFHFYKAKALAFLCEHVSH